MYDANSSQTKLGLEPLNKRPSARKAMFRIAGDIIFADCQVVLIEPTAPMVSFFSFNNE
jgi:hypothetical protein